MRSLLLVACLSFASAGTAQFGTFVTSESGCPAGSPPTLSLTPAPLIGTPTILTMHAVPGDALAATAVIGLAPADLPLDFLGATGCSLFVDAAFSMSMTLGGTEATVLMQLPIEPSSIGRLNAIQGVALSPSSNPFGLAMSNRGILTIGSPPTQLWRDASCAPVTVCTVGGALLDASVQGGSYAQSAFTFASSGAVVLGFQGIGTASAVDFTDASFRLDIWVAGTGTTATDEFAAAGSVGNFDSRPLFVDSSVLPSGDWLIELEPMFGVTLPAGDYLIAVSATSPGLAGWQWRESDVGGLPADLRATDGTPGQAIDYLPGFTSGAQAVDVIGY